MARDVTYSDATYDRHIHDVKAFVKTTAHTAVFYATFRCRFLTTDLDHTSAEKLPWVHFISHSFR